jgi:hypothetical protein
MEEKKRDFHTLFHQHYFIAKPYQTLSHLFLPQPRPKIQWTSEGFLETNTNVT